MSASQADLNEVVSKLRDDERYAVALAHAVNHHEEHMDSDRWQDYSTAGMEYSDLGVQPWLMGRLVQMGLLDKVYNSNSKTRYRVDDLEFANKVLTLVHEQELDEASSDHADLDDVDPDTLFTDVVGHDEVKKWLRRTIREGVQVHHLLYGEPGSGKSEIADDIRDLPGAHGVVFSGEQTSAAGLTDVLLEHEPTFLVVEEIEKGAKRDRQALMTLCGKGYVQVTKGNAGGKQKTELDTVVVATANEYEKITPDSLRNRFMEWRFEKYDFEEFRQICRVVLPRDHDVDGDVAEYIAQEVFFTLESSEVREAERIAKLADSKGDVEELVDALKT